MQESLKEYNRRMMREWRARKRQDPEWLAAHRKKECARAGSKPAAPPAAKPTADQAYEASLARVRAYLKLPARARWANRGMHTDTELRMAEQMWQNGHGGWEVRYNTILH